MMFLYHIFNPPSGLVCDNCKKDLEGAWYQCKQCTEVGWVEWCGVVGGRIGAKVAD